MVNKKVTARERLAGIKRLERVRGERRLAKVAEGRRKEETLRRQQATQQAEKVINKVDTERQKWIQSKINFEKQFTVYSTQSIIRGRSLANEWEGFFRTPRRKGEIESFKKMWDAKNEKASGEDRKWTQRREEVDKRGNLLKNEFNKAVDNYYLYAVDGKKLASDFKTKYASAEKQIIDFSISQVRSQQDVVLRETALQHVRAQREAKGLPGAIPGIDIPKAKPVAWKYFKDKPPEPVFAKGKTLKEIISKLKEGELFGALGLGGAWKKMAEKEIKKRGIAGKETVLSDIPGKTTEEILLERGYTKEDIRTLYGHIEKMPGAFQIVERKTPEGVVVEARPIGEPPVKKMPIDIMAEEASGKWLTAWGAYVTDPIGTAFTGIDILTSPIHGVSLEDIKTREREKLTALSKELIQEGPLVGLGKRAVYSGVEWATILPASPLFIGKWGKVAGRIGKVAGPVTKFVPRSILNIPKAVAQLGGITLVGVGTAMTAKAYTKIASPFVPGVTKAYALEEFKGGVLTAGIGAGLLKAYASRPKYTKVKMARGFVEETHGFPAGLEEEKVRFALDPFDVKIKGKVTLKNIRDVLGRKQMKAPPLRQRLGALKKDIKMLKSEILPSRKPYSQTLGEYELYHLQPVLKTELKGGFFGKYTLPKRSVLAKRFEFIKADIKHIIKPKKVYIAEGKEAIARQKLKDLIGGKADIIEVTTAEAITEPTIRIRYEAKFGAKDIDLTKLGKELKFAKQPKPSDIAKRISKISKRKWFEVGERGVMYTDIGKKGVVEITGKLPGIVGEPSIPIGRTQIIRIPIEPKGFKPSIIMKAVKKPPKAKPFEYLRIDPTPKAKPFIKREVEKTVMDLGKYGRLKQKVVEEIDIRAFIKERQKAFPTSFEYEYAEARFPPGFIPSVPTGKIEIRQKAEPFKITKPVIKVVPKIEERIIPREILKTPLKIGPKIVPKTITRAVPKIVTKVVPRVIPRVVPKVVPKVITRVVPRLATKVVPRVITKITPKIVPKIGILGAPLPRMRERLKPEIGIGESYRVLLKIRGKWKVAKTGLTRAEAIEYGRKRTKEMLVASFKIEREDKRLRRPSKISLEVAMGRLKPEFREFRIKKGKKIPLKDMFIQKKKYRLGTMPERREIQIERKKAFDFKMDKMSFGFGKKKDKKTKGLKWF